MINIHAIYVATSFLLGAIGPGSNAETEGLVYATWVSVDDSNQIVSRGHESYASEQISQLDMEAEALLSALEWAAEREYRNVIVYSANQSLIDSLRQHQMVVHRVLLQDLQAAQAAINARLDWIDPVNNLALNDLATYISGNQGAQLN